MQDHVLHLLLRLYITPHEQAGALALGMLAAGVVAGLSLRETPPSAETIEQARRERLTRMGRITDGSLVDTTTIDGSFLQEGAGYEAGQTQTPHRLLFRYRIAGVAYEAVQDVSTLGEHLRDLRIDLPIQVRYDQENPADSIVVGESWCGLRFQGREQAKRASFEG